MSFLQEKIAQAKLLLKEFSVDCWLTYVRETGLNGDPILPYLIDSDVTWHSAFIITARGESVAIVGSLERAAILDTHAYDRVEGYVKSFSDPFLAYLKELNPQSIAVNYSVESEICDGLTHGMYLHLRELLASIGMAERLCPAERIISALRQRKSSSEIAVMKEAIQKTLEIYEEVRAEIKPGISEKALAEFMQERVRAAGATFAWDPGTCPSVFTGPETAGAHYGPTDRLVERGHVVNMDFGVKWEGYCSDLQRTYYIRREGEVDAPEPVRRGFATIVRSIEAARSVLHPGVQGIAVDTAARSILTTAGYEEFPHALGHQVGRFAHDGTALLAPAWEKYGAKPFEPIEEGMVFTIEPRLTVPGFGVVTIEEMVLVGARGAEYLSSPQKELYVI